MTAADFQITPIRHAVLSASGAPTWGVCPGSIAMRRDIPATPSHHITKVGTALHEVANQCLEFGLPAGAFVGQTFVVEGEAITISHDDADMVQWAIDRVDELTHPDAGGGPVVLLETSLPIDHITGEPGAKSTLDVGIVRGNTAIVLDFKFGRKPVSASSDQLVIYADMLRRHCAEQGQTIENFECVIVQPPLRAFETVTYTRAELAERVQFLRVAAKSALSALAGETAPELNAGGAQCRYCPAAPVCPAAKEHAEKTVRAMFPDMKPPAPAALAWETIDRDILPALDAVEDWIGAVRQYAFARLLAGETSTTHKLVAKKKNRDWRDDETAAGALRVVLGDRAYVQKVVSPAAAEKAAKAIGKPAVELVASILETHLAEPVAEPTLAPITDKRPAFDRCPAFPVLPTTHD